MFKARDTSSCISGLEQDESLAYVTRMEEKNFLFSHKCKCKWEREIKQVKICCVRHVQQKKCKVWVRLRYFQ